MPEYAILFEKKSAEGKKGETETIFAPSVGDAWIMARQKLPKSAKIIDIVRLCDFNGRSTT